MNAHLWIWEKEIKCKACRAFYPFFTTSLIILIINSIINSIIQEHECYILFIIRFKTFIRGIGDCAISIEISFAVYILRILLISPIKQYTYTEPKL